MVATDKLSAPEGTTGGAPVLRLQKFEDVNDVYEQFSSLRMEIGAIQRDIADVQQRLLAKQQPTVATRCDEEGLTKEELDEKVSWIERLYMEISNIAEPLSGRVGSLERSLEFIQEQFCGIDERVALLEHHGEEGSLEGMYDALESCPPSDVFPPAQQNREEPRKTMCIVPLSDRGHAPHMELSCGLDSANDTSLQRLAAKSQSEGNELQRLPEIMEEDDADSPRSSLNETSQLLLEQLQRRADPENSSDVKSATSPDSTDGVPFPSHTSDGNESHLGHQHLQVPHANHHHHHRRHHHHHSEVDGHGESKEVDGVFHEGSASSSHCMRDGEHNEDHRHHHHHHHQHHHGKHHDHANHGDNQISQQRRDWPGRAFALPRASLCMAQMITLTNPSSLREAQPRRYSSEEQDELRQPHGSMEGQDEDPTSARVGDWRGSSSRRPSSSAPSSRQPSASPRSSQSEDCAATVALRNFDGSDAYDVESTSSFSSYSDSDSSSESAGSAPVRHRSVGGVVDARSMARRWINRARGT